MTSTAKLSERNASFEKENILAKILKDKIKSFLKKGWFVKIDDNNFLLFEKEEHYFALRTLERILFDLFENIKFEKEEKEIGVSVRLSLIMKYIKKMRKIMFGSFYVENENKCPFKIKFPHLWYMKNFHSLNEHEYNILDDLNKWGDLDEM